MYRFQPRLAPTVFVLAGGALLCSLGMWQLGRREDARIERARWLQRVAEPAFDALAPPADPDGRRVSAAGVPEWDRAMLLSGKYMWGQAGVRVIVPLRLAGGAEVLVDVGWVPQDQAEAILASEAAISGPRAYRGQARAYAETPSPRGEFPVEGRKWRAISPFAMGGFPSWVVTEGEGIAADADIPDREPPIGGWRTEPNQRPHGEYAFTWFGLASTLALVWLTSAFRREEDAAAIGDGALADRPEAR